jgi:uncharacterized GH25 family protein
MPMKTAFFLPRNLVRACVLSGLLTSLVFSHDTWLSPARSSVPVGATVTLDLTSGMAFPLLEYAIKAERIERAVVRLGGQQIELSERRAAAKSLRFTKRLETPGVATAAVSLQPKALELTPRKVAEYLAEIGAGPEIRQAWAQMKPQRWREVYVKHAKTFVRVGAGEPDQSWAEPIGLGLEIVPETDPTQLHAGAEFPVRVLKNGQPLAAFPLGLLRANARHGIIQKTDAAGRTVFKLPAAGKWLLRGTELRRAATADRDWESDFTTLTVAVLATRSEKQ